MKYNDLKVIKNGNTTIVYGVGRIDNNLKRRINRFIQRINWSPKGENMNWCDNITSRGVAKLAKDDVYDEMTGVKIASRKAELQARKTQFKHYDNLRKELLKIEDAIFTEEMNIGKRIEEIKEELEKY